MSDHVGLPKKPRIPKHFTVVPMADGRIQVRSAHKTVVLGGKSVRAVGRLLELLDGTRELEEIARQFPDVPEAEVFTTLKRLAERGLVEDTPDGPAAAVERSDSQYAAQMTLFKITSDIRNQALQDALEKSHVAVFGLGRVGSSAAESLARAGVGAITAVDSSPVEGSLPASGGLYRHADVGRSRGEAAAERVREMNPRVRFEVAALDLDGAEAIARVVHRSSLVLVCQDAPEVAVYRAVNEASLQEGVPWLKAAVEGLEAHLGPAVIPGETACYTCYELRTRANWTYYDENLAFEEYLAKERPKLDYGGLSAISGFLGNLAALEAVKLLTGFLPPVACGRLFTFNMSTLDVEPHNVLRLPRCPSCGIIALRPKPVLWSMEGG